MLNLANLAEGVPVVTQYMTSKVLLWGERGGQNDVVGNVLFEQLLHIVVNYGQQLRIYLHEHLGISAIQSGNHA